MPPTWETSADPSQSQHSIDEEQAAARAIEALEREAKAEAEAESPTGEPLPNATPGDIRNAESLERFGPGTWLLDGRLCRVPQALSRYATNRARTLVRSAESTESSDSDSEAGSESEAENK